MDNAAEREAHVKAVSDFGQLKDEFYQMKVARELGEPNDKYYQRDIGKQWIRTDSPVSEIIDPLHYSQQTFLYGVY